MEKILKIVTLNYIFVNQIILFQFFFNAMCKVVYRKEITYPFRIWKNMMLD